MTIARNATFGGAALVTGTTGTVSTTPLQSAAFSCSGAARLVLVAVGLGNTTGTVNQPTAVSWVGGTPANATDFEKVLDGQNSGNNHTGEFWVARVLGALSGVQVQVAPAASSASSAETLAVDVLDGDDPLIVSATVARGTNASAVAAGVTLPNVRAGAWLYGVGSGEGAATWSPVANFTELDDRRDAGTANAAFGLNATGTAGDVLVGWSNTVDYGGWAGIEVREQPAIGAEDGFSGGWDSDRLLHLDAYGTPSDALWPDSAAATVLWEFTFPTATGDNRTGTPSAFTGAAALGTAAGTRNASATAGALAGAAALGTAAGAPARGDSVSALAGAATLGDASGTAAIPGDDRTGTPSAFTGAASLGSAAGSRDVSAAASALGGAGALGSATGARAATGAASALAGAAALGSVAGARAVTAAASALAGAGALGTLTATPARGGAVSALAGDAQLGAATGTAGGADDRVGSPSAFSGAAALGAATGSRAVTATASAFAGAAALGAVQGYSARAGAAAALAGLAELGLLAGAPARQGDAGALAGAAELGAATGTSPAALDWLQTMRPARGTAEAVAGGAVAGPASSTAAGQVEGTSSTTTGGTASEMEEGSC